jgi:TPR repeat protein
MESKMAAKMPTTDQPMKILKNTYLAKLLLLALALSTSMTVIAQTWEQSSAAYKRKDYATALIGFKKLADKGDALAQYGLGVTYADGIGVPKDDQQAVIWYRKAAEQGKASAQYNLGVMYADGRGVPKDDQQAVIWYRKAAEQGDDFAQQNLGRMYAKGTGVPKDDESAYFWFLLSSAQANENATKNRDLVEKWLTPTQRANAQAAARIWKAK